MKKLIIHSKKILIAILIISAVTVLLLRNVSQCTKNYFIMDTYATITVKGINAQKSVLEVYEVLKNTESKMNSFNENSALNKGEYDKDILNVLEKGIYYGELSGGLFDITIKPLTELWNVNGENPVVPTKEQIDEALSYVNYKNSDGAKIDLGGIAKGYATDVAVLKLKENKIKDAVINIGGNVYGLGTKKIGLQNPAEKNGEYLGIITVTDSAVVTSGAYQRYFEQDGEIYHHILNPKTGYPAQTDLLSATVIHKNATDADALSTILFMLGKDKAIEFAKEHNIDYVLIDNNNYIYYSENVNFKLTDNNYYLEE